MAETTLAGVADPRSGLPFGFLAGVSLGVGLALLAFALIKAQDARIPIVEQLIVSETAIPSATPAPTATPSLQTVDVLNVSLGPGTGFAILGTLPKGATVDVVSRDSTGNWLSIQFPPNSNGRGWLPADKVVLVTPTAVPEPAAQVTPEAPPAPASAAKRSDHHLLVIAGLAGATLTVPLIFALAAWLQDRSRRRAAQPATQPLPTPNAVEPTTAIVRSPSLSLVLPANGNLPAVQEDVMEYNSELTPGVPAEQSPAPITADAMILRGFSDFSIVAQESVSRLFGAIDKLGQDAAQAFATIAEERQAATRRQEELLDETRRASEQAQGSAEQATQAANQAMSSQSGATELRARLQEDRDGINLLITDLRNRIAALSVLGAPLPSLTPSSQEAPTETTEPSAEGMSF